MADNYQYGDERDAVAPTDEPLMTSFARLPQLIANAVNPTGADLRYTPRYTLPDIGLRMGQQGQPAIGLAMPQIPSVQEAPVSTPYEPPLAVRMGRAYRKVFDALGMPPVPDNSGINSLIFSHREPYSYLRNRPSRPEYVAPNTVPYQRFPGRPETVAPNPYVTEQYPARPEAVAPNTVPYQRFPARPGAVAPNPYVTSEFEDRPRPGALAGNMPPRSDFYSLNTGPYSDRPTYVSDNTFPDRTGPVAVRPEYVSDNTYPEKSVADMKESTGRAKMTKPVIPRDAEESKGRAHMRTKEEQKAEDEGEFLNNDPEDTRPGSLGEARKLFPNRPLQQAIYYTDERGNMRRLGVGADTKGLNMDNVARIWEPADMSFGEKAIRGAFEKQGPNPLTWSPGKAEGGAIDSAARIAGEKSTPCHVGLITMAVGGRTDHIPMNVLEGSYVLPADIVSGLGEGNTLAGSKIIENMFKSGPFGVSYPDARFTAPKYPETPSYAGFNLADMIKVNPMPTGEKEKAGGGSVSARNLKPIPIVAAGGEYVIDPDTVRKLGGGSIDKGHEFLDHFVKGARKELVKTLQKLPGPKRD